MINDLPSWCCASDCRHCPEFQARESQPEPAEPPTAWCERCEATTYTVNGSCAPCGAP